MNRDVLPIADKLRHTVCSAVFIATTGWVCLVVTAQSLKAQSIPPAVFQDTQKLVADKIEAGEVAGATHLVILSGKQVHLVSQGVADIETQERLRPDAIVRIYSMSKPITSVAAMTLYEKEKFQLDDPIAKFIPEFQQVRVFTKTPNGTMLVPPKRPITVRDVFRHTTGYAYGGNGIDEVEKAYRTEGMKYRPPFGMFPPEQTIEEAAKSLARIPLLHHPGEQFTYGFSTDLLGRLIEVWSGQTLDSYLEKTLFEPLGMVDTGFQVPKAKVDRFASCHAEVDGRLVVVDKAESSPYTKGFVFLSGGGGLVSTANDYGRFCQMLVNGGKSGERRILKEQTVQMMFTDQLQGIAGDFRFGLGFAINDKQLSMGRNAKMAAEYSWAGYASTDFRIVPEASLIQIFLCQKVPSSHALANEVFQVVYAGFEAGE